MANNIKILGGKQLISLCFKKEDWKEQEGENKKGILIQKLYNDEITEENAQVYFDETKYSSQDDINAASTLFNKFTSVFTWNMSVDGEIESNKKDINQDIWITLIQDYNTRKIAENKENKAKREAALNNK